MVIVQFSDKTLYLDEGQILLDALLANGESVPHSCRSGFCQACMLQATEGVPPESSQTGLKNTLKSQGYFLSCQCKVETNLKVSLPDTDLIKTHAVVSEIKKLSPNVVRIRLTGIETFKAGQFITIFKGNIGRSYSIASVPSIQDYIEIHVKHVPNGVVSPWLFSEIKVGDLLEVILPGGNCFYELEDSAKNILLVGTGTGLAPLYGIANDAINSGHVGEIHLIHGGVKMHDLYMHNELKFMADRVPNFQYHPSILEENREADPLIKNISVGELVKNIFPKTKDLAIYLAGPGEFVKQMKKQIFMAGASTKDIYADSFN